MGSTGPYGDVTCSAADIFLVLLAGVWLVVVSATWTYCATDR
nr:hypothetical protein [Kibdelosporangium sp. MJ126-NF4]CTQ98991.1 hypothetical protein [Kibdelosporangium sp. MJ126-NF4]